MHLSKVVTEAEAATMNVITVVRTVVSAARNHHLFDGKHSASQAVSMSPCMNFHPRRGTLCPKLSERSQGRKANDSDRFVVVQERLFSKHNNVRRMEKCK